jgi:diketogulonate reductase-like aldo/keto reductase
LPTSEAFSAQVVIRWHLDSGLIVIPGTVRLERLRENIGALNFKLDGDDVKRIEAPGSRPAAEWGRIRRRRAF